MKMKALVGLMTAVMSVSIYAADTNINITGKVVAQPCTVNGGNSSLTVDLGDIPTNLLYNSGTSSALRDFTLVLTNCPVGTSSVTATFSGTTDPVAGASYYKNTGTASNVAVAVIQSSTGILKGTGTSITQNVLFNGVTYDLKAKAYSSAGKATPGTVMATVVASMTYN